MAVFPPGCVMMYDNNVPLSLVERLKICLAHLMNALRSFILGYIRNASETTVVNMMTPVTRLTWALDGEVSASHFIRSILHHILGYTT